MKISTQNELRKRALDVVMAVFVEADEDVGQIASNAINFPVTTDDGEDAWIEISVKIPKDDGDDGYMKRDEYAMKERERAEKAAEREAAKQKKIARDKAAREAKKKANGS